MQPIHGLCFISIRLRFRFRFSTRGGSGLPFGVVFLFKWFSFLAIFFLTNACCAMNYFVKIHQFYLSLGCHPFLSPFMLFFWQFAIHFMHACFVNPLFPPIGQLPGQLAGYSFPQRNPLLGYLVILTTPWGRRTGALSQWPRPRSLVLFFFPEASNCIPV